MKNQFIELLAPAGSFESLKAAVANGANAVYLGGGRFNARVNAGNFSGQELVAALDYAHERGVKVYLTLNTLLKNDELNEAMELAAFVSQQGADAVIVQDLGLLRLIKEALPELPVHVSTQATVTQSASVRMLEQLGASRVVLARELSLEEIKTIRQACRAELEVFVHGALCVCYSGQCLMSSFIGGRSGNRGLCAQPCRLPWALSRNGQSFDKEGYLLSPRDLMALDLLPRLKEAGVSSLKLEGRMKSPEYVAIVTGIYRKYLDLLEEKGEAGFRVSEQDRERLLQAFNRGGFTQHYLIGEKSYNRLVYTRHPKHQGILIGKVTGNRPPYVRISLDKPLAMGDGLEIMDEAKGTQSLIVTAIMEDKHHVREAQAGSSPWVGDLKTTIKEGSLVYKTLSKPLFEEARQSFERGEMRLVPVDMAVTLKIGEPLRLQITDDEGHAVSHKSEVLVEKALKKPMTEERLKEQLQKTGDTPYGLRTLDVVMDPESTVPVSAINALRREALEALKAQRIQGHKRPGREIVIPDSPAQAGYFPGKRLFLTASFVQYPSSLAFLNGRVSRVYLPIGSRESLERLTEGYSGEIFLWTPSVLRDEEWDELMTALMDLQDLFVGLTYGSLGTLSLLKKAFPNKLFCADQSMNVFNRYTAALQAQSGAGTAVLSPELMLNELKGFETDSPLLEAYAYGRLPLMTMEHCPSAAETACSGRCEACNKNKGYLKDRKGEIFPFVRDPRTRTTRMFNAHPMFMDDMAALKETPISYIRLAFLHEDEETMAQIVDYYAALVDDKAPSDTVTERIKDLKSQGFTKGHWFRGVD